MAEDVEQAVAAAHQEERQQVGPPRVDGGELRPDSWLRPANLPGPTGDEGLAVVRGPLAGGDPVELSGRLWPLATMAARATELAAEVDEMLAPLVERRAEALPAVITLAAEVVRFLRAEPLLPPPLTPQPWPPDALRDRYRRLDRVLGRALPEAVSAG